MKPRYILEAEALMGQKEIAGKKHNPVIVALYKDAGHPEVTDDETAWCAALVGACLYRDDLKNSGSLMAKSYASYGVSTAGNKPELYCIGVMHRGAPGAATGHVGFVVKWDKDYVWMLGGNQNNSVSVAAFPRSKFIAFRKPVMEKVNLVHASKKVTLASYTKKAIAPVAAGTWFSWEWLSSAKTFMADNAGLLLVGVLGLAFVGFHLIQWWSEQDYKQGRYTPRKSVKASQK